MEPVSIQRSWSFNSGKWEEYIFVWTHLYSWSGHWELHWDSWTACDLLRRIKCLLELSWKGAPLLHAWLFEYFFYYQAEFWFFSCVKWIYDSKVVLLGHQGFSNCCYQCFPYQDLSEDNLSVQSQHSGLSRVQPEIICV